MGGAERQDVPMTQSLNAVSTLAQDHRNIETHPNTVCVLHSVTQHSVNTNTRSQRVIYQHIETQYHRVCTTQSQHEDNTAHNKTFSPKKAPSQILSKSFFDLLFCLDRKSQQKKGFSFAYHLLATVRWKCYKCLLCYLTDYNRKQVPAEVLYL